MTAQPLTKRQRQVFDFIASTLRDKAYSPSLTEIGEAFGLSSLATVWKHVKALEEKGYIVRAVNRSRSITLLRQLDECPCCGQKWPA